MKSQPHKRIASVLLFGLLPLLILAQTQAAESTSYFSNTLFNMLLILVVILLLVIFALSNVLKSVLENEAQQNSKEKSKLSPPQGLSLVLFFSLLASQAFGQDIAPVLVPKDNDGRIGGLDLTTFYFLVTIIVVEVIVIYFLYSTIQGFVKNRLEKTEAKKVEKVIVKEKSILEVLNASVDIENEAEIMLDHNYDGIQELDNDLPPWWKYGFVLTVLVAVLYLLHYHGIRTGDLQGAEYKKEVAVAKLKLDEFMRNSANNVDETTVKFLSDAAAIQAGKDVYTASCVACHSKLGEGSVGPNLTDNYWIHGGSISDLFKTIKYGWPDKGMKAWKEDLSPMQIAQVASYIKTLVGTNPPNPKAPQGELYIEKGGQYTSQVKTDSNKIASVKVDTTMAKVSAK
jgi:cytochrome c oxidase cbb3-type subunit III